MSKLSRLDYRSRSEVNLIGERLDALRFRSMTVYPQFLSAVTNTFRTEGYYLYCTEGERLTGISTSFERMNPFASRTLSSIPGGFWAEDEKSERLLWDALLDIVATRKLNAFELKDLHGPLFTRPTRINAYRAVRRLVPGQDLMSTYSKNIRRDIRAAVKYGLRMEESAKVEPFYTVWAHHMRDLGTPPLSLGFFKNLQDAFGGNSKIFLVKRNAETIGGAFILYNRNYATDLYLSSLRSHFKYLPNVFLYHEMMSWAARNGIGFFDLGRSQPAGTNEKFKLRFGAELLPLYSCPGLEKTYPAWMRLFPIIWKRIPISVSNRLGPSIRRYRPFA